MASYDPNLFDVLFFRSEIKSRFGNRKNWYRFCDIARRLWWQSYTARLICNRI